MRDYYLGSEWNREHNLEENSRGSVTRMPRLVQFKGLVDSGSKPDFHLGMGDSSLAIKLHFERTQRLEALAYERNANKRYFFG